MGCTAIFNNISVISWWSVLLVEKTAEYPEKSIDLPQVTGKLDSIMLYRAYLAREGFELTTHHRPVANHWETL